MQINLKEADYERLNKALESNDWIADNFYGSVVTDENISFELTTEQGEQKNCLYVEAYDLNNKQIAADGKTEFYENVTDDYPFSPNAIDFSNFEAFKASIVEEAESVMKDVAKSKSEPDVER